MGLGVGVGLGEGDGVGVGVETVGVGDGVETVGVGVASGSEGVVVLDKTLVTRAALASVIICSADFISDTAFNWFLAGQKIICCATGLAFASDLGTAFMIG